MAEFLVFPVQGRPEGWVEKPEPSPIPETTLTRLLYHFTSLMHLPLIEGSGYISRGDVPLTITGGFNAPWLTADPEAGNQKWSQGGDVNKTAVRLTIQIPVGHRCLHYWPELAHEEGVEPRWFDALARAQGGKSRDAYNWYIFKGRIPMSWVVAKDFLVQKGVSPLEVLLTGEGPEE